MAKKGTDFSKYAQAFYENIDCGHSQIDMFTKHLLRMGLTGNDKAYIDDIFPEIIDKKGERHIEGNKGDMLRKYFSGTNGLSRLTSKFETEFDSEFLKRYCYDLQWYDEEKIIAFARSLNIAVGTDDFEKISKAIARLYSSILNSASKNKRSGSKKLKDNSKSDAISILSAYSFSDEEKTAIINISGLISKNLEELEKISRKINNLQKMINNDKNDEEWKNGLRESLVVQQRKYAEEYKVLSKDTLALGKLIKPKKRLHECIGELLKIAPDILHDKYSVSEESYSFDTVKEMIMIFRTNISLLLAYIK